MITRYFSIAQAMLLIVFFASSCHSSGKSKEDKGVAKPPAGATSQNINISIFLDISDRINPKTFPNETMEYYERDLGYIQSIQQAFVEHISNKKVILMNDAIQVFLDPAPANRQVNKLITDLKISLNKSNISKEKVANIGSVYSEACSTIYKSAIDNNNFIGSDIWGFMKNKVNDYCISSEHRNILIILTDGYVFHQDNKMWEGKRSSYMTASTNKQQGLVDSNWKSKFDSNDMGFITANKNLDNLEVLVLGTNPAKTSPHEQDVIKAYWEKWLDEMGVKKHAIKSADLPTNLDGVIRKFILNN